MTAVFDIGRGNHAATSQLTESEVRHLQVLLIEEREALSRQLAEHARALGQLGQDDSDVAGVQRELVGLHAARARDMIEEVDGALSRVADGSYGACESCGRSIPFERLEAIPRARYCVACPPISALRR